MEKAIAIASDHGGFELKEILKEHLVANGHEIHDYGTDGTSSVDYPDYAYQVTKAINGSKSNIGVLVCGTGIGISIAANRIVTIRAALVHLPEEAKLSREHNNANIICFGGRIINPEVAKECLDIFLSTEFIEGGRHSRRIKKMTTWGYTGST